MCTKKYYPLVKVINIRLKVNRCYDLQTNYQLLVLLSQTFGVAICPSRSQLIRHTGIDSTLLRKLTDKALDKFKRCERLIIDDRLLINDSLVGINSLDACSDFDRQMSLDAGLSRRTK